MPIKTDKQIEDTQRDCHNESHHERASEFNNPIEKNLCLHPQGRRNATKNCQPSQIKKDKSKQKEMPAYTLKPRNEWNLTGEAGLSIEFRDKLIPTGPPTSAMQ